MRPLVIQTNVTEKNVVDVKAGAAVNIVPTAEDETKIAGQVAEVSMLPVGEGQFPLNVAVTGDVPEWVVPGMTCKVKVTTYTKDDALTVPASAVRTDEEDKEKKYVLVQVEGADEPQRRDVKVGKTNDGKTEILEGVQAGDQVLIGDPKSTEKADEASAGEAAAEGESGEATDEKPAEEEAKDSEADQAETEEDEAAEEPQGDAENDAESASEADE
jgi:hypothetical protein